MNKIRTAEDNDRFRLALVPVDRAMWASEQKWGVGRLERLQRTEVLLAYRRGWDQYRVALEECDAAAIEAIGPKMIQALAIMDAEATAAGHLSLDVLTWEAPMTDGTVLVVVRSQAEQSAVLRASRASDGQSYETTLPPDLAVTVRHQHEGRALQVWTMAELVRLIEAAQVAGLAGVSRAAPNESRPAPEKWQGNEAPSGVQQGEGVAADIVRSGYPLVEALAF